MQLNFLVNCGSARGTRRTRIIVRGIIGINDFYLIKVKRDIGDSRIFINNKEQIVGAQQVFQKSRKFYRKDSVFICFDRISLRNKKREGRKIALPCFAIVASFPFWSIQTTGISQLTPCVDTTVAV